MYQYLLNMWIMRLATEAQINACAVRGYITTQQRDMILATPQAA